MPISSVGNGGGERPKFIDDLLREIGPLWQTDIKRYGDRIKAAYLPLQSNGHRRGIEQHLDIPYGSSPRQVLDIYAPKGVTNAPAIVFVHGGAFVRGEKNINAGMYSNVALWFANQGYVAINAEYRLAPEASFPAGAVDVAKACEWIANNISDFGGNPECVSLMGHSAGGTHAASYAFDASLGFLAKDIAALVLVSARLRADCLPENPNAAGVKAYFGEDAFTRDQHSPVEHAQHANIPTFIIVAEYENPLLDVYGLEMAYGIARHQRRAPRFLTVPEHNHVSIVAHFNTGESFLGNAILSFLDPIVSQRCG